MKSICYCEDEKQYGEVITQLHNCVAKTFYGEVAFDVVPSWMALVQRVKDNRPSVILLDLALPPDSPTAITLESLEMVWREWPPVMALTGNKFDLDLRKKCFAAGCDDFMLKEEANRHPEMLCERLYHCFLRRGR